MIKNINPYNRYPEKDNKTLSAQIIRAIKGPLGAEVERTYKRHLTLLVLV